MSEPKRLIDETDSPLERLVLQAGNHAPGGDRLRGKVLVALGVGAAVASTSKTSLAMAAGWKQAIVVGALSCVGVASVVGYRQLSSSDPVKVAASANGQGASAKSGTSQSEAQSPAEAQLQAEAQASKSEISKTGTSKTAAGGAEVGSEAPSNLEAALPKHEGPAAGDPGRSSLEPSSLEPSNLGPSNLGPSNLGPNHLEPGAEAADEAETQNTEGSRSNVHSRPAQRAGVKRTGRVARPGSAPGAAAGSAAAGSAAAGSAATGHGARPVAEHGQAERAAADVGSTEATKAAPPSTLEQELAVLDAARGALAAGRWGDAQRHLGDYAKRFPRGKLGLEAEVLRIEALASSGDPEGASHRASAILKRSPNSVVAARLRRFVRE